MASRTLDNPTKQLIDRLDNQVKEYESTYDKMQQSYAESVISRNAQEQEAKMAQQALTRAQNKIATLEERLRTLLTSSKPIDPTTAAARIAELEKRVASQNGELEYSRQAYQRANQDLQSAESGKQRLAAELDGVSVVSAIPRSRAELSTETPRPEPTPHSSLRIPRQLRR